MLLESSSTQVSVHFCDWGAFMEIESGCGSGGPSDGHMTTLIVSHILLVLFLNDLHADFYRHSSSVHRLRV